MKGLLPPPHSLRAIASTLVLFPTACAHGASTAGTAERALIPSREAVEDHAPILWQRARFAPAERRLQVGDTSIEHVEDGIDLARGGAPAIHIAALGTEPLLAVSR